MTIAPIRRSVVVKAPPARAFTAFTKDMARWWPAFATIGANPFVAVVVEPREGGRWFERDAEGNETEWGKVLAWEPPGRVVLAWQIDAAFKYDPNLITEVEMTFTTQPDGATLATFEHRNLERMGDSAAALAEMLGNGWVGIVDGYAAFASESSSEETAR